MSVATELHHSPGKQEPETRKILGPGGNRVRVLEEEKKKKKPAFKSNAVSTTKKLVTENPKPVAVRNGSDSPLCNGSAPKSVGLKKKMKKKGTNNSSLKAAKVVPDGAETLALSPTVGGPVKRCDWITPNSGKLFFCLFVGNVFNFTLN